MTHFAVGLEHLFWIEADTEEEAIAAAREELGEMDEEALKMMDFGVFDQEERDHR